MLEGESVVSNRLRFAYVLERIYNEYNYDNIFGILKIIENNRKMLDWDGVLPEQKHQFIYLEGYNLMSMGEVDDAQKMFYELLDIANVKNDTSLMLQSLKSLGELFTNQNDFVNAEKYSLRYLKLLPEDEPLHKAIFYVDLVNVYLKSKQLNKAEYYNQEALELVNANGFVDIQVDFLLHKISINLEKRKPDVALDAYREASELAESIGNDYYQKRCKLSYAEILEFQNRYGEALSLYEQFIKTGEEGDVVPSELKFFYQWASNVADKKGDFKKAFRYVVKANQISDSLFVEEQNLRSKYLQIKFDADQKEKENALLSAQILQEQSQNRFLYALIALFFIGTVFLVVAFLQKRKYNRSLESEVKSRTSELENANKSLQNLNGELSELTYSLSHDLKEPLLTIVRFSEMATKEISAMNAIHQERVEKFLEYISKSGKRLHVLLEDISSFHSIGNPSHAELKLVDVKLLIDSIVDSIQYLLQDKHVIIKSKNLPTIYSYETRLFMVFKNLIENGVKYNKSISPTIHIDYKQKDDLHVFLIKDNGIGIAPEFHERVFGIFKRLHNREEYDGSGLGLNIVKKIVEKLDGNIDIVESELNEGSVFQVSLPILKPIED